MGGPWRHHAKWKKPPRKTTYCVSPSIHVKIQNRQICKDRWFALAHGAGGRVTANGYGMSSRSDELVLKLIYGFCSTTLTIPHTVTLPTLNGWIVWYVNSISVGFFFFNVDMWGNCMTHSLTTAILGFVRSNFWEDCRDVLSVFWHWSYKKQKMLPPYFWSLSFLNVSFRDWSNDQWFSDFIRQLLLIRWLLLLLFLLCGSLFWQGSWPVC